MLCSIRSGGQGRFKDGRKKKKSFLPPSLPPPPLSLSPLYFVLLWIKFVMLMEDPTVFIPESYYCYYYTTTYYEQSSHTCLCILYCTIHTYRHTHTQTMSQLSSLPPTQPTCRKSFQSLSAFEKKKKRERQI